MKFNKILYLMSLIWKNNFSLFFHLHNAICKHVTIDIYVTKHCLNPHSSEMKIKSDEINHLVFEKIEKISI